MPWPPAVCPANTARTPLACPIVFLLAAHALQQSCVVQTQNKVLQLLEAVCLISVTIMVMSSALSVSAVA